MREIAPMELIGKEILLSDDWRCGAYSIGGPCGMQLKIMSSNLYGWEHVSVSLPNRTPNWKEMCFVKDLFWREDETVIQFHPPKHLYVNVHPNCLHMWRSQSEDVKTPPRWMIGPYPGWENDVPQELRAAK